MGGTYSSARAESKVTGRRVGRALVDSSETDVCGLQVYIDGLDLYSSNTAPNNSPTSLAALPRPPVRGVSNPLYSRLSARYSAALRAVSS